MATIRFLDKKITIQDGTYTFKMAVPGTLLGSRTALGGSPPVLTYSGGMEARFLLLKDLVEDLVPQQSSPHDLLTPASMLAILAIETGPVIQPRDGFNPVAGVDTGMMYSISDDNSKYNPRVTSASHAINVAQVTFNTGQEYGVDMKDRWNYAESIRGGIHYFNRCLHELEIPGNRDATLLTAAMGYNAGFGYRTPSKFWALDSQPREYAKRYFSAYNEIIVNHYPGSSDLIDYQKFVSDFELSVT